ncbi:DUF1573 domain-containing protein [Flavobacteriaceae bacterium]|jgi:hypothetical protein|nr:DUF1573 domain-containing protein [Flavobacteriaceae bacterium]MDA9893018.1 DUF1573 domain-containing protein [Flavobacteriaceae bacterium]MDC1031041.1 DUF1573 domain-containing protein [Flavobacteriaceae bacterium]MDC1056252.1 DUF1573 domain-containing protein [Flavobacteriaceae bacterium]MDC3368810.1 DUF1573 domain-containing protein [Flavobacteriaceae bacterium]
MKLKHYLNLFLLCAITPAFAQETGAQINFETTTIDYGTIANGSNGERVFSFTNSGSEALIIKNVQSSCGCTIPKKPEGPIAPGETSEIIVRYDTKRTGPFRKTITVTTNVEQNTIVALKIKGTVLPKE